MADNNNGVVVGRHSKGKETGLAGGWCYEGEMGKKAGRKVMLLLLLVLLLPKAWRVGARQLQSTATWLSVVLYVLERERRAIEDTHSEKKPGNTARNSKFHKEVSRFWLLRKVCPFIGRRLGQ